MAETGTSKLPTIERERLVDFNRDGINACYGCHVGPLSEYDPKANVLRAKRTGDVSGVPRVVAVNEGGVRKRYQVIG
jgi:hypothetical protein